MADGKENYLLDLGCDKAKEYGTLTFRFSKEALQSVLDATLKWDS